MKSIKTALLTNGCICIIIAFVYFASFGPLGQISSGPQLKGCTGGDNIALQITVAKDSNINAYMDTLERAGAKGTFFFCEQCGTDSDVIEHVKQRGHGVGYYVCANHKGRETDMYIGGGFSVPVMQYQDGETVHHIAPSIDLAKLKQFNDWPKVLDESLGKDMFIRVIADNVIWEFEKVVQIVSDKGYTMLKVDEML